MATTPPVGLGLVSVTLNGRGTLIVCPENTPVEPLTGTFWAGERWPVAGEIGLLDEVDDLVRLVRFFRVQVRPPIGAQIMNVIEASRPSR